jgi:hypothetical protein
MSPFEDTSENFKKHDSLRPKDVTALERKRDSSKASEESRKLSIQMIEDEFNSDRMSRRSRTKHDAQNQLSTFINLNKTDNSIPFINRRASVTPTPLIEQSKRLVFE